MTARRVSRLSLIVFLTLVRTLAAQVRGTVVDPTNVPIPGVSVFLTDTTDQVLGRALTDGQGTFGFRTVAPGRYRLRTMRIGFLPTRGPTFAVAAGQESVQRLTLSGAQVRLDTVRVVGNAVCEAPQDSLAATFLVWDQARAALTATQLTAADRALFATTVGYERFYDPEQKVVSGQRVRVHANTATAPWVEVPADSLHRSGYVTTDKATNEVTFEAPGIETLLSPIFAEDHCFRLAADTADASRIGLAFEPNLERRNIADVKGTLWLDRRTSELRSLVYEYANAPSRLLNTARGAMAFARASNGSWIISGWNIRMPELGSVVRSGRRVIGSDPRVIGVKETGGEVALMKANGDTAWVRAPVRLIVVVTDSATGKPMPGSVVALEEADIEATADSTGRATMTAVPIGNYTMQVRTPALDELGVTTRVRLSVLDSETVMGFRVPSAERIRARGGTLAGTVVAKDGTTPIIAAEVQIPDLSMAVRTDGQGAYVLEHIAPGEYEVQVRRLGYAPLATRVRFSANRLQNRTMVMEPVVVLDSVVTTDAATDRFMAAFEDHRRIGVGHFITRDSLARFDDRTMADVLSQISSVDVVALHRGSSAYAATHRRGGTCLTQVYLDKSLVYRGGNTSQPRFDVNSVLPSQVEAIEFYAGPGEIPAEYATLNSTCGVLVIWTRRSP